MSEIAKRLTNFFIRNDILNESDRVLYAYCFELSLVFVSNFFVILLIALVTNTFLPTVFYLIGFWPLRMFAGGYHAKTPGRCFIMTLTFFLIFLFTLSLSTQTHKILLVPFILFSFIVVFLTAPIESPNKPFRKGQRELFQRKSRLTVLVLSIIALCGFLINFYLSYALSCGMVVTAISLILSRIQCYKKGGGN